ncbi:MAG: hypothetical protein NC184_02050 [Roseburia sp.]|nr:hypothetical protein [Roseburia sp.]
MPKIEFRENKTLKLTNVLSRKVPEKEIFNQDKQISMLMNWIKAKGHESFGPLIIYSSGIKGADAEGEPIIDSRIMIQLKASNVRIEMPYRFEREMRVPSCLLARFDGDGDKIQHAVNKLTLYAYENDIELTGETYIVLMEQQENRIFADVFMPVMTGNEGGCE